jgi:site-specific DNA recombinase
MGRLTLNVLLSFAQFEREVIGERVRDKVAASKRKGMWMGGCVPFGYEVRNRKLNVHPKEAEVIRHIFERYVTLGSAPTLLAELREQKITTNRSAKRLPMTKGGLYHILSNRIYRGQIVHKGEAHPGEHEAIIGDDVWNQTQACLETNRAVRRTGANASDPSLLAGMMRDSAGRRLAPSHARKGSLRYRYYISVCDAGPTADALRLSAGPIEQAVRQAMQALLADERGLLDLVPAAVTAEQSQAMLATARELRSTLSASVSLARALLLDLKLTVVLGTDAPEGSICMERLLARLGVTAEGSAGCRVPLLINDLPTEQKRGIRMVVEPTGPDSPRLRDGRLIELLLRAREAYQQVVLGHHRFGETFQRSKCVVRLARLNFLAPDIVDAIVEGRQPASLNARRLSRIGELPASWEEQRRLLGFA